MQIQVVERGITLTLSLAINSGVVGGLDVTVPGRAFPEVTLTSESGSDRRGKLMRLDVEPSRSRLSRALASASAPPPSRGQGRKSDGQRGGARR